MARLEIGQALRTREPVLLVENELPPGEHRFQLEVVTGDGRVSKPDGVLVTVARAVEPVPGPTGPTR